MKIIYKVVLSPDTIQTRIIECVDYVSIGKRSISYRLRFKEKWIHSLRLDSVFNVRILEDDFNNEN